MDLFMLGIKMQLSDLNTDEQIGTAETQVDMANIRRGVHHKYYS